LAAKFGALGLLYADLMGYGIYLAIVTETFFREHHRDELCCMSGYQSFRRDRKGRGVGSVAIYIHEYRATYALI